MGIERSEREGRETAWERGRMREWPGRGRVRVGEWGRETSEGGREGE